MRIIHPHILLVLIPIVPVIYLTVRGFAPATKWVHFGLRLLVSAAILAAAGGLELTHSASQAERFYLLDHSDSIGSQHEALRREVQLSLENLPQNAETAIIGFGKNASVEYGPAPHRNYDPAARSAVDTSCTNIEAALALARSLHRRNAQAQIVLVTDGNQNRGDAAKEALLSAAEGIQIFAMPLERPENDLRIETARYPSAVNLGKRFLITARILGTGRVRIAGESDEGGHVADEVTVDGSVLWEGDFSLSTPGMHEITLRITSPHDTVSENNQCTAIVYATGNPRLLIIGESSAPLATAAKRAGYDAETLPAGHIDPLDFPQFDAIIIDDTPAWTFPPEALGAIRDYVQSGGGLIMAGTGQAFGPGGYAATSVEDVLPVQCDPKEKKSKPVQLALVIDTSGSMAETADGRPKLGYAQEGALHVARRVRQGDRLSVMAFDTHARTVANWENDRDLQKVGEAINQLFPHGATNLNAALQAALQTFAESGEQEQTLRHAILLSDGRSKEPVDGRAWAGRFAKRGVSISVVATGDQADEPLLRQLAELTGGNFHTVKDMSKLPEIMAQEARPSMDEYIKESSDGFSTAVRATSPLKLPQPSPQINQYVLVKPKETAEAAMQVGGGSALLTLGRAGAGRTVAFASSSGSLDGFSDAAWAEMIRWAVRRPDEQISASATVSGGLLRIEAADAEAIPRTLSAMIIPPSGDSFTVLLNQNAPNLYVAELPAEKQDVYAVSIFDASAETPEYLAKTAAVVDYSDEWKRLKTNNALLQSLTAATGGHMIRALAELPDFDENPMHSLSNAAYIAVLLALICFLVDLALP